METEGDAALTERLAFVFTDVVGSSKLWATDPESTARSFAIHDAVVRSSLRTHNGEIFGWAGDSFRAAFADRRDAAAACHLIHRELANADWRGNPSISVRIGVTYGHALARDGEYFGPTLNTAARLEEMARPGQTVVAANVAAGLDAQSVTALGRQRVRDVAEAMELFQLGSQRFAPPRAVESALSSVPAVAGTIIGRDRAIAEARAGLDQRLPVVVVGAGGAGKTRLAIEVAHLEMRNHPDGCYFIDLASVSEHASIGPAIARSCRIKLGDGDPFIEIGEHFADRHALLILDNCEHVVAEAQHFIRVLLSHAPSVRFLATSRESLAVRGERLVALGPLETGVEGAAVELFVQRIREHVPEFSPSWTEIGQIAKICGHLDGIPLALELAAARASVLGLEHLLQGMDNRFRMLSSARGDDSRTLWETIDWSFGLLSEREQDFFLRCGVFNGSFDLPAASALVPTLDPLDVADLLHSLSRKSLVISEGALSGRFRLLETVRAYAVLRLAERDVEDDVRQLHLCHYVDLVATTSLATASDLDRAVELAPEWSNMSGALEWAAARGHWQEAARLASGCLGLWEDAVPTIEGKRWVETILPHLDDDAVEVGLLMWGLALFEAQLDNFDAVKELLQRLCESPFPEVKASGTALLGYLLARVTPQASLPLFDAADAMVCEHDLDPDLQIMSLWTRGSHALYEPNLDEAHRCFSQGFELARCAPHRTANTIYAGLSLATTQLVLGQPAGALNTLNSYSWSDSRWDSSAILRAVALLDLDRADEAADLVLGFARTSLLGRLRRMSNDAMIGFAALALHRGDHDHAWELMRQAITPRTPFTIGLVEGLADRIGRGDELRALHRTRTSSLAELDAIDHLKAELARLDAGVEQARVAEA